MKERGSSFLEDEEDGVSMLVITDPQASSHGIVQLSK